MKELVRFEKNSEGKTCGLMDRTLIIYEGKTGNLKGELWVSNKIGWKSKPNQPISTAWFKDGDATIYRVKEYYNF